jgi:hypothetical protein
MSGQVFTTDEAEGIIPVHPNCECTWVVAVDWEGQEPPDGADQPVGPSEEEPGLIGPEGEPTAEDIGPITADQVAQDPFDENIGGFSTKGLDQAYGDAIEAELRNLENEFAADISYFGTPGGLADWEGFMDVNPALKDIWENYFIKNPNTNGVVFQNTRVILINPEDGGLQAAADRKWAQTSGWHYASDGTETARHEYAHILDKQANRFTDRLTYRNELDRLAAKDGENAFFSKYAKSYEAPVRKYREGWADMFSIAKGPASEQAKYAKKYGSTALQDLMKFVDKWAKKGALK